MLPLRLLLTFMVTVVGMLFSTTGFAWQSTSVRPSVDFRDDAELTVADDEITLQDKTPAKPKDPPKPPTRPQTPPAPPSRPSIPPVPVPAQPQQPQPQFNPFVNPQPNQPYLARLSRAPDMFGDSFGSFTGLTFADPNTTSPDIKSSEIRLPKPGGPRVFKNEQSRAMPTDRVFGLYHHFQNAYRLETASANVDLFTLGFEKTFLEGNTSIELRMPLSNPVGLSTGVTGQSFQTHAAGDLIVTFKGLVYSDESQAVALGLAVNTPTGSDLNVTVNSVNSFTLKNDAAHLIPFVAYQAALNDDVFFNGFLQFDTPTNANSAQSRSGIGGAIVTNGSVTDQTLMYVDASFGYWLFRDDEAEFLQGLAGVLELHYTTALNRADNVDLTVVEFGATSGRYDVLNLTVGLQANIARNTLLRAAFVTPLTDSRNRFFDSEFSLAVVFQL
ncbi:MAG: hypothetical protein FJ302_09200 [Planctomycetes bacterium]|nr:hypothetical protein [Planctomycetota bacterium]